MPDGMPKDPVFGFLDDKMKKLADFLTLRAPEYALTQYGTPEDLRLSENPALVKVIQMGLGMEQTGKIDQELVIGLNTFLKERQDKINEMARNANPNSIDQAFDGVKSLSDIHGRHIAHVFEQMRDDGLIAKDKPEVIRLYAQGLSVTGDRIIHNIGASMMADLYPPESGPKAAPAPSAPLPSSSVKP